MSEALHRIIQIAVRHSAGRPSREQLQILQDCDAIAPDALRSELGHLIASVDTTNRMLRTFEATPDEDQI
ncbi:MAG TPA: hypothetical protein DEA90_09175 [Opitutae bacterium]|nr:hypothetical protein [Puniceicoccaceae bacterium]HBR94320.1 hypothetical protein [Opitutae bacterium]|tara:strand:- start:226 stop:435 length:210 start_codon:yes stop_codon:yes gene_type:complete